MGGQSGHDSCESSRETYENQQSGGAGQRRGADARPSREAGRQASIKGDQQQQKIRELRSQAKLADNITAEVSELKAEVMNLKDEVRELTRANREHVIKNEALQAENAKLKAEMKVRKPNGTAIEASVRSMLQPSLS
jgi:phage host-nuclease inhibitor protein Gam